MFQVGAMFFTIFVGFTDQFGTYPAATVIRATGHQLVSLCRSVCEEEKAQLLSPLMNGQYLPPCVVQFCCLDIQCPLFCLVELNEVLDRLRQGPSQSSPQRVETSDTSGDETDASQGRRKILSKKTYRMKKVYAATELGRFFVTGASDAANMPSHFYCRLCRKNVPVLTHGHHEVLRHFQGRRHFARDQRLRLETPGWRVLDFQGNPLTEDELERQRESIEKGPLVVRDREHPFAEDLISDEAGVIEPQLPVLTKVSCLVDGLKMRGSYGLIEKLWGQFVLTAGPVAREVAWTRDEVLVGSVDFRNPFVPCLIHIVVLLLVNYHHRNAASNLVASGWVGQGSSFL